MTEQEIIKSEQGYSESKIQHICVNWFRQTFPHVGNLLFAVPNGGWRGARAGAQMKVPKKKGSSAGTQKPHQIE